MQDNTTPLYIKIPTALKVDLQSTALQERTSLVGLCTDILTTGVKVRSKINEEKIATLINASKVYQHGQN